MSQIIVTDYPPLYNEIARVFNLNPNDCVIFSWGERIYNPMALTITPELLAHEMVHGLRQGTSQKRIEAWWAQYMSQPKFRLEEEILAHRAEYQWFMANGNRKQRRTAIKRTSKRLAAPLYGDMISVSAAKDILRTH
jgi:hypothetical protein